MNLSASSISVIGCGELGSSIVRGLPDRFDTVGCDRNKDRLIRLEDSLSFWTTDQREAISKSDLIFLCVKPQDVGKVLEAEFQRDQIILSVAAGIKLDYLKQRTNASVARIMPNLGVEHSKSATTVCFSDQMNRQQKQKVRDVLEPLGAVSVIDEELMSLSTALNGSGPGFVYYIMKAFKQAGIQNGMSKEKARTLSVQTFRSAAATAYSSDQGLEELLEEVCTEGGTTFEGMQELRSASVDKSMIKAISAAQKRAEDI